MSQTQLIIPEINEIVNFYTPELVEKIAKQTDFVQRESRLGGIEFLGVMTQGLFCFPDASLSQMSAMAKDINPELDISKQGFDERINEFGVSFLKSMFSKALELSTAKLINKEIPSLLDSFRKVHLLDSTYIPLPSKLSDVWSGYGGDGSKAGMKLQLMIEYKSGNYESIVTTDGVTSDQRYMGEVVKQIGLNELLIYDLGYSKQDYMIAISQRESYFVSRFNHQLNLYKSVIDDMSVENVLVDKALRRFDLETELRKLDVSKEISKDLGKESLHEFELYISNSGKLLKIRLIVESVPKSIVEQRIKKAKRKAGKKSRKPSAKYLYLQNWNLYITNIEKEKIVAKDIILLYKIRWQVEIVFKSWKSYHGLEHLEGKRKSRIECFMYGRLIMIVIMCFLFNTIHRNVWNTQCREASLLKVIKHFQVKGIKILSLLLAPVNLAKFLFEEFLGACRHCLMDVRKRLTTAQKVRLEGQAFVLA
jgi:hypothetical protein